MAIEFPKLPYDLDALEPHLSRRTLEFHYGKHHRNYVDQLNKLISGTAMDRLDLEEIMAGSYGKKPKIYNNAAQAWNHDFYWKGFRKGGAPLSREFGRAIAKHFGSLNEFKQKFTEEAKALFGSGWVWLVKDGKGRLQIRPLGDAENPLQSGESPLLACDVWEHAYYLDYQNERPKYLKGFWAIVDWEFVERNADRPAVQESRKKRTKSFVLKKEKSDISKSLQLRL